MNYLKRRLSILPYILLGCILIPLILLLTIIGIIGLLFICIFKCSNSIVNWYEKEIYKIIHNP